LINCSASSPFGSTARVLAGDDRDIYGEYAPAVGPTVCDDRPVTEATRVAGQFWTVENPGFRVRGEFTAEVDDELEAALDSNLVPDPRVTVHTNPDGKVTGWVVSGRPERSVAAFQPITLQGELDTGDLVTLLDGQNYGNARSFAPRYRALAAVIGAHVSDDQLYSAVRLRLDRPHWLAHLTDGESSVVEDDGSTLSVEASEDGNWLVYESSSPATLRKLELRVVSGCLALLQLALYPDEDRVIRETQVRIEAAGRWLTVRGAGFRAEPGGFEHQTLLTRDHLTVKGFAKWIALHSKLDGLTWVVARPFLGAVQTRVLLLTPLVEGFHRRLPDYEKRKFPGAANCVLRRISKAARKAAGAQADAEGLDRKRVKDAVVLFTDVSFQQRAEAVVAEVHSVVPEIAESFDDLPRRIKKARNDIAHHLSSGAEAPLEIRALEWLVVAEATSWLLRCLLLLRVGIEPQVLHKRLMDFQRFGFFRANTAQHVRELGW
jgi:hypothetical protein